MSRCVVLLMFFFNIAFSSELRMLYEKNYETPQSAYEIKLVNHVKNSFEKALKLQSNLTGQIFQETADSIQWRKQTLPHYYFLTNIVNIPYYHLLNNLCNFSNASHAHVGLLAGDSFIAALYQNEHLLKQIIAIDWFQECPLQIFNGNCQNFIQMNCFETINGSCFNIDKTLFSMPIDIYFYDADHSLKGQEMALTYYNDLFADVFVAVIDDCNCPWIRGATFKAFDKLQYSILYENIIPATDGDRGGQYVAVIKKNKNLGNP